MSKFNKVTLCASLATTALFALGYAVGVFNIGELFLIACVSAVGVVASFIDDKGL